MSTNGFANTNCINYSARHVCIGPKYGSHWNANSFIYWYMLATKLDCWRQCWQVPHANAQRACRIFVHVCSCANQASCLTGLCVVTIREERASILFARIMLAKGENPVTFARDDPTKQIIVRSVSQFSHYQHIRDTTASRYHKSTKSHLLCYTLNPTGASCKSDGPPRTVAHCVNN